MYKALVFIIIMSEAVFSLPKSITLFPENTMESKLDCNFEMGSKYNTFLNAIKDKYIGVGTFDGSVVYSKISRNNFGIFYGSVSDRLSVVQISGMPIYFCDDLKNNRNYILLYGDKVSPIGTYKYEAFLLIPTDLLNKTIVNSNADLRWGKFSPVVIKL